MMADSDERWLKRQAFHIASQLPDDTEAAERILSYAMELVGTFLMGDAERPVNPRPVVLKLVTRDGVPTEEEARPPQEQGGSPPSAMPSGAGETEGPPYKSSPR